MKCVCGYEYEEEYDEDDRIMKPVKGDEEFIASDMKISYEIGDNYYRRTKVSSIYICPKCKTLRVGEW